ncbi:hypothetical protein LZ31DRAFT_54797 [Colletotrichum somersetense]|nr:hypothetical protein LZ31DRAFT_54797 [Colletotrichum somersetense]
MKGLGSGRGRVIAHYLLYLLGRPRCIGPPSVELNPGRRILPPPACLQCHLAETAPGKFAEAPWNDCYCRNMQKKTSAIVGPVSPQDGLSSCTKTRSRVRMVIFRGPPLAALLGDSTHASTGERKVRWTGETSCGAGAISRSASVSHSLEPDRPATHSRYSSSTASRRESFLASVLAIPSCHILVDLRRSTKHGLRVGEIPT